MKNNNLRKNIPLRCVTALALLFLQSNFLYAQNPDPNALPQGASIVNGTVTINASPNTMNVAASDKAIVNWNSYNIGQASTVNYIQPSSSAVILNRVIGVDPSSIYGKLNANGNVFIVNPNGIYFGAGSQVNVGGLVASTLGISNSDFIAGNYNFQGNSSYIINHGNIHIVNGGYVLLLSNAINNSGTIQAQLGHVLLASGEQMTVALDDNNDICVTINNAVSHGVFGPDGQRMANAIENSGSIQANGGKVLLNAKVLNGIFDNAVNNSGVVQANSLQTNNGDVEIVAAGAAVTNSGNISASNNLTISSQNGIISSGSLTTANTLTLKADTASILGDITGVNLLILDLISSSAPITFTSSSNSSFQVNTVQTNYGSILSRNVGTGTSADPIMIYSDSDAPGGLQYISTSGLDLNYQLVNNINAAETSQWNSGAGFVPIGNYPNGSSSFTGTFNGNSHTVSNLYLNNSDFLGFVGLFGITAPSSTIENLGLLNVSITALQSSSVGALVGYAQGRIINSYASGTVIGNPATGDPSIIAENPAVGGFTGGLVGINKGSILNSYADVAVTGGGAVGGLVGANGLNDGSSGSIADSYALGNVSGGSVDYSSGDCNGGNGQCVSYASSTGGLVGSSVSSSSIINSFAIGNVTAGSQVGGLVGSASGTITSSYAAGTVINNNDGSNQGNNNNNASSGGLVGSFNSGEISDSFATGNVQGGYSTSGGFVGSNSGTIKFSYATGNVSGEGNYNAVGGFVGSNGGGDPSNTNLIKNSYATGNVFETNILSTDLSTAGGFVGINQGSIFDSYATGNVTGGLLSSTTAAGGFAGIAGGFGSSSTIVNSYSTGSVSNGSWTGGFIGANNYLGGGTSIITNDAWFTGSAANAIGDNGGVAVATLSSLGYGADEATLSNFYSPTEAVYDTGNLTGHGWDFNGLWTPSGVIPIHTNQNISVFSANPYPQLLWQDMGDGSPFIGGTALHPFQINNLNELQFMGHDLSATYGLASNIDATASSGWNNGAGFKPVGNNSTPFTGSLNGNNYTISNLYENPTSQYAGLFGETSSTAVLSNIQLSNVNISNAYFVSINDPYMLDDWFIGALVGYNYGSVTNSSSSGTIHGSNFIGGLVGYDDGGAVTNSNSSVNVTANYNVGGLVGLTANGASVSNSYATGNISGIDQTGGLVGFNGRYTGASITDSYSTGTVTSAFWATGGLVGYNLGTITNSNSSSNVSGDLATGGLIGYNSGSSNNSYCTGTVNGRNQIGGFVGYDDLGTSITNAHSTGTVTGVSNTGGFVGYNYGGSISNSYSTANVTGHDEVGGFAGHSGGVIDHSSSTGNVIGNYYGIGGLVGENTGTISNSYARGNVSGGLGVAVGGLAGYSNGSISNAYSTGSLSGGNLVGGLVGYAYWGSSISNSYRIGDITGVSNTGGLVGYNLGSINASYNIGNVSANDEVGGLVGASYYGAIIDSYSVGNVSGTSYAVGGLVGDSKYGSISNSYSLGNVNGNVAVGGLVGYDGGAISNSYSVGNVSGYNEVGGLAGFDLGPITNSFAIGHVSGVTTNVGGLTGIGWGSIRNSYYTDNSHGNSGGIYEPGGAAAFYNPAHPVYAIGKAGGWDISTPVWAFTGGLPLLAIQHPIFTWVGGTSNDWLTASNWSGNEVPYLDANIALDMGLYNPTLFSNISALNLSIESGVSLNGNYDLNVNGNALINGSIGDSNPLASFYVGGSSAINGGFVRTSGAQTYNGPVTLGASTTNLSGTGIDFMSTVDGSSALTINDLDTTQFNGAVGANSALSSLTINGTGGATDINGGSINTNDSQNYNNAVVLGADTILNGNSINLNNNLDGAFNLTINDLGTTTIGGVVGGGSAYLKSLTINAANGIHINGRQIFTHGAQNYNNLVILGNNTSLTGKGIAFSDALDSLTGFETLDIFDVDTTTFEGAVGSNTALGSLTISANNGININGGAINTNMGFQSYDGSIALGADTTIAGNGIYFGSTIDGNHALTINDLGSIIFEGPIGSTSALNSLTVTADGIDIYGRSVNTINSQTYNNAVMLGNNTKFVGNSIAFNSTIDGFTQGAQALEIDDSGTTILNGSIGATTALSNLTMDSELGNTTYLDAGSIKTTGAQTYNNAVVLASSNETLNGNNISFNNTLDSLTGVENLEINDAGTTTFGGAVGSINPLGSLTIDPTNGSANINGGTVITTNSQTYNNPLILGNNTKLVGNNINFNSTIDGATLGGQALEIDDGGTTIFNYSIGSNTALASLTMDTEANNITYLNGATVNTVSAQTYNNAVVIVPDVTLEGHGITFNNTLDSLVGSENLAINDTGTTTFAGAVGSADAVGGLTVNANQIDINNNIASFGDINLNSNASLILNGTIQSLYGAVNLTSNNGSINGNPSYNVTANADSLFSAPNGTMGLTSPVNVNINGNLTLNIGQKIGSNSGALTGTINNHSTDVPTFSPFSATPLYPPGFVTFNGNQVWPISIPGLGLSQIQSQFNLSGGFSGSFSLNSISIQGSSVVDIDSQAIDQQL